MENTSVVRELLELERTYWQAIKDQDTETALRLTDEGCIIAGARGYSRIDKKTMGEMMRSPSYTIEDFELVEGPEVQMVSLDVAVLAYRVREKLTVDGKPVTLEATDSSTWVRRNGRWVCALHTESPMGDPFGRDRSPAARA